MVVLYFLTKGRKERKESSSSFLVVEHKNIRFVTKAFVVDVALLPHTSDRGRLRLRRRRLDGNHETHISILLTIFVHTIHPPPSRCCCCKSKKIKPVVPYCVYPGTALRSRWTDPPFVSICKQSY